jgi:hypothetical protein
MRQQDFESSPSSSRHPLYDQSMLYTTAPEWSTGEVLLSSAYRCLILGIADRQVDLANISSVPNSMPAAAGGRSLWSSLLSERGGIASPLKGGQKSPVASRQLMPIVPSIARIAGVLGARPRSRWNPANLMLEAIGAGIGQDASAAFLREFGEALDVGASDDVFSRFVEQSLQQGLSNIQPLQAPQLPYESLSAGELHTRAFRAKPLAERLAPAERFCRDLRTVLAIKDTLTRRQWTVLVESILRIGLGMHVLWTCNLNIMLWEQSYQVASGAPALSADEIESTFWEGRGSPYAILELGADAEPLIKRLIERYAFARTGLNLLLCRLDDIGAPLAAGSVIGHNAALNISAPAALSQFLAHLSAHRHLIDAADAGVWLRQQVTQLFDQQQELRRLAQCRSGYTKNLLEFARHSLGQIKTKDPEQRCYDLAYLLAYAGDRKPLTVQPGPAMLVTLVHACCRAKADIPTSIDEFRRYLGDYCLNVRAGELNSGKTGGDLSRLGLVIDSPDAAGGRLLVPPF